MLDYALLFIFHCFFWFVLGAFSAIIHHRGGAMKFTSAMSVGVISFIMHVIAIHFGWVEL